jgi:hypothetical protein
MAVLMAVPRVVLRAALLVGLTVAPKVVSMADLLVAPTAALQDKTRCTFRQHP